jgi:hypothetical protein
MDALDMGLQAALPVESEVARWTHMIPLICMNDAVSVEIA